MSGRLKRGYSMILKRGWKKIREWYSLASKRCRVAVNRAIANRDESSRYRKQSALDSTVLTRMVKGMAKEHEYKGKQDDLNGTHCIEWIMHVRVLSSFAFIGISKIENYAAEFFLLSRYLFFSYSFTLFLQKNRFENHTYSLVPHPERKKNVITKKKISTNHIFVNHKFINRYSIFWTPVACSISLHIRLSRQNMKAILGSEKERQRGGL